MSYPPTREEMRDVKPTHYKIVCISMYTPDIDTLNAAVRDLKGRGWTKANKSHLIRIALSKLDLDQVAREMGKRQ